MADPEQTSAYSSSSCRDTLSPQIGEYVEVFVRGDDIDKSTYNSKVGIRAVRAIKAGNVALCEKALISIGVEQELYDNECDGLEKDYLMSPRGKYTRTLLDYIIKNNLTEKIIPQLQSAQKLCECDKEFLRCENYTEKQICVYEMLSSCFFIDERAIVMFCSADATKGEVAHGNVVSYGIWKNISSINHSCGEYNVCFVFNGPLCYVIALHDIEEGEELFLDFCPSLFHEFKNRRNNRLNFSCKCTTCRENDFGSIEAIHCGYLLKNAFKTYDAELISSVLCSLDKEEKFKNHERANIMSGILMIVFETIFKPILKDLRNGVPGQLVSWKKDDDIWFFIITIFHDMNVALLDYKSNVHHALLMIMYITAYEFAFDKYPQHIDKKTTEMELVDIFEECCDFVKLFYRSKQINRYIFAASLIGKALSSDTA